MILFAGTAILSIILYPIFGILCFGLHFYVAFECTHRAIPVKTNNIPIQVSRR
jgi:hypothetical protein